MRLNRPTNILANGRFFPPAETTTSNIRNAPGEECVLKLVRETNVSPGVWCGVEVNAKNGKTDGKINEVQYFSRPSGKGEFALISKTHPAKKPPKEAVCKYFSNVSDSEPHSLLGITDETASSPVNENDVEKRIHLRDQLRATSSHHSWCDLSATLDTPSVQTSKYNSFECDESLGILTPDQMGELTTYSNDNTIMASKEAQLSPTNAIREALRLISREKLPINQSDSPSVRVMASKCNETCASFVTSVTSIGSWDNGYQGDGECSRPTSRGAMDAPFSPNFAAATRPSPDPPTDSDFYTESDYEEMTTPKCAQGDSKARIIEGELLGSPPVRIESEDIWLRNLREFAKGGRCSTMPEEMDSSGIYSDMEKILEKTKVRMKDVSGCGMPNDDLSNGKYVDNSREKDERVDERIKVEMKKPSSEVELKRPAKCKESSRAKSPIATKAKTGRQNANKMKTATILTSSIRYEDENRENHRPSSKMIKVVPAKKIVNVANVAIAANRWNTVTSKTENGRNDKKQKIDRSKEVKSMVACDTTRKMASNKLREDVKVLSPNANTINKAATVPAKQPKTILEDSNKLLKTGASHRIVKSRKMGTQPAIQSPVSSVSAKSRESRTSSRNSSITDISNSQVNISRHILLADVISTKVPTRAKDTKLSSLLSNPVSDTTAPQLRANHVAAKITKMSPPLSLTRPKSASKQIENLSTNVASAPVTVPRKTTYRRTLPKVSTRAVRARMTNCVDNCTENSHRAPSNGKVCKMVDDKTRRLNRITKIDPLLERLKYATDGMEAFAILFQRLTSDTDVFALDGIKRELSKCKKNCLDMKIKLDELNVSYKRLKEEIETERSIHEQKLKELRDIHTAQLGRLNEKQKLELEEHFSNHELKLKKLKDEFKSKEDALQVEYDEKLRLIRKQAEQKLENILQQTKSQVELLKMENEAWKDKLMEESWKKVQNVEMKFKSKMEMMEANYADRLDQIAREGQKRKETLVESSVKSRMSNGNEFSGKITSNMNCGGKSNNVEQIEMRALDIQNIEDEICSLRMVLDLKHGEIQELRKQNEKFKKAAHDLPFVEQKLDLAQARVEDLSAQLQAKVEIEKKLLKENRRLLETVQHENEKKKRLAFQNEELWWKLKNSTQVAKTLAVYNNGGNKDEKNTERTLAHSTPFHQSGPSQKYLKRSRTEDDIKFIESSINDTDDISSKVLGVVEKNESVSWVLEIDESPVAVASRMLKRANSLKNVSSKRRSKMQHKLQQSLSVPSSHCENDSGMITTEVTNESISKASSMANRQETESENGGENSKLLEKAKSVARKFYDKLQATANMDTFFDFSLNSDSEEMDSMPRENGAEGESGSPFSNTSSSDSSLELDGYDIAALKAYSHNGWNASQAEP